MNKSYECDICGIPLDEDEVYTVYKFYGEDDAHFCYYHYSQMGFDSEAEYYPPLNEDSEPDD
ncbi:hypothetical protein [Maridesulfovibrio sp.]|uniref:hypothetical protein n=1 Tax=Maridesulfovibrio sp. TaxID=2795000 RepID=UPI0039EEA162